MQAKVNTLTSNQTAICQNSKNKTTKSGQKRTQRVLEASEGRAHELAWRLDGAAERQSATAPRRGSGGFFAGGTDRWCRCDGVGPYSLELDEILEGL